MSTETHGHQPHFEALVEHLATHAPKTREHVRELYGAPSADPRAIAEFWCAHPDTVLEVLDERLSDDTWFAVEQLAFEHDLPMDISWLDRRVREQLRELALIRIEPAAPDETWMPAGLAAILAPRLPGTRPTIPVLLGRSGTEEIERLAAQYNIPRGSNRIETILAIAEAFASP